MDYPAGASRPAFPTRNGTRQQPDNVRARILRPIPDRANELLAAEGRPPIAHMTPHTLRRTFASILAVCDVPPRRAMYLLGHTDPKLTLAVYQQVLDLGKGAVDLLEQVLGCTLAEARAILNGEAVAAWAPERIRNQARKKPPPQATRVRGLEKPAGLQGTFRERLKGLEPSTFCMANISSAADLAPEREARSGRIAL
jgi:hypothetical protein